MVLCKSAENHTYHGVCWSELVTNHSVDRFRRPTIGYCLGTRSVSGSSHNYPCTRWCPTNLAHPHQRLEFKSSRSASSLWCQQCQQLFLARSSRASPLAYWRVHSGHCRRLRPKSAILYGVQAQLHGEFGMVPLVRVLVLSPDCRSTLGVWFFWHVPLHTSPITRLVLSSVFTGEVGAF